MSKGRLEAFSDGVIAIIITIMVLELKAPRLPTLEALCDLAPDLLGYLLSFVYVGIYWNNHHHMLQAVRRVTGSVLWANMHLLFWLSLVPFATRWMGSTEFAAVPVAAYGIVLLLAGCAYFILSRLLIAEHGQESPLATAVGADFKGRLSVLLYAIAIPLAFANRWVACGIYVLVAVMWLVPDRRIESVLKQSSANA
ncbi:MAG TPA: TMEM175 family protein [Gemmataceae bacterium]|nr:TMEM175 family protein [Gemmataceae bacterium]